jgi:hypothetical protein
MMDENLLLSQQLKIRILPITLVLLISIFKVEAIALYAFWLMRLFSIYELAIVTLYDKSSQNVKL